ncbi:putative lipid II flippase FtsW [Halostreptopolyspora alba]|uniref:Probable peptidoglycan glycosyltransferase FtsW n=1 Tax=Halostreptopolyspora alba TaxID=2487137 RepID=A0A3N0EF43_9ACTN|nr:putative lipid II flippase FtsW [Nocardiopsaceae bacterium YIM 96095]
MSGSASTPRGGDSRRSRTSRSSVWLRELRQLHDHPLTSYYLVIGSSCLLIALGLVMVLSSSMIDSITSTGSAFSLFQKQLAAAAVGLPLLVLASHLPVWTLRALGYPAMALALALLLITVFQGEDYGYGAVRWLEIGGVTIQPSEPAKLAFALWGADVLARKDELKQLMEWRQLLVPLLPGCGALVLLVLMGTDLSTTMVLLTIFLALLWVVGAPGPLFVGMFALVVTLAGIMVAVESFRGARITSFLNPGADPSDAGFQPLHGLYALGTGGVFGVGIGDSKEKWGFLPHPESDFIFAIIGEELGLIGSLLVVGLFGVLGYAGLRIASRAREPFVRLAAMSITAWIAVQAMVNIGTVIKVVPVTGIPLPLVSAGGSALVPTMFGVGVLLALAKAEPDARKALAARGPNLVQRALGWLGLRGTDSSTVTGPQERNGSRPTQVRTRRNRRR